MKNLTYFVTWIAYDDVTEPEYEREFSTIREAMKFAISQQEEGNHCVEVSDSNGFELAEIG
ncbi:hypothetical protein [uncultured Mediterranean phage uvMED]|nr:hypothetical protein [uncultured Mediterranean phage uvMED]BAR22532.1 hypothetical protein [uncultured Mediterranean phage uvMED]